MASAEGRQEAVSLRHARVFSCFEGCLVAWFLRLEQWNFIRFRSDVWPGQRGGTRPFRHAVPGYFPDSKGVLWLGFSVLGTVELPARTLMFFIRFRSDVWPGQRDGRRLFRHTVPGWCLDLWWLGFGLFGAPLCARTRAAVWTLVSALNAASLLFNAFYW